MLTYTLKKAPGMPLYEALYRCIREDIRSGKLQPGDKLPSKRALASNLEVSKNTVEGAYNQLLSEGYISSREKIGYFVEDGAYTQSAAPAQGLPEKPRQEYPIDLTRNAPEHFPFSVWSRLQRQVMLDLGEELLQSMPNQGVYALRKAICDHLAAFRGMQVSPENVLIGAGGDFLCNLLMQLLGKDKIFAVEEPGYEKTRKIYLSGGVKCVAAPMDDRGVIPQALPGVGVLHISPSHHFPTGLVTPLQRRKELLAWAAQGERYIIEDDYDSEFRFNERPVSAMFTQDRAGSVIYMNSFSKSLAPSIRISYLVLPHRLMEKFRRELGFYGCTVPSFEQHTLARFISQGHFEKHINRLRRAYKLRRDQVVRLIQSCPFADKLTILEQDAGLHFLVKVDSPLSAEEMVARCQKAGINIRSLQSYYHRPVVSGAEKCLLVNYSSLRSEKLPELQQRLANI